MKRLIIIFIITTLGFSSTAQTLSIEECYDRALDASQINTQREVNRQTTKYDLRTASAAYIPQAQIDAQASYQSDVVSLPFEIPIPGFDIMMAKDQYRATLDLKQLIYDGGYVARQRKLIENRAKGENERIEIAVLELKERVSGIYLGILLSEENQALVELMIEDIATNIKTMEGMIGAGVASRVDLDVLRAERMKAEQKIIELRSNRCNLVEMLGILTGSQIAPQTRFVEPNIEIDIDQESNRPEYRLMDTRRDGLRIEQTIVGSRNLPKAYAFATAGNGRPGLNMLSNNFDWFAMAGVKLTVPLTEWTSTASIKRSLTWKERMVEANKKEFEQNNRMQIRSELNRIDKLRKLIESDLQIVEIRKKISAAEREKLIGGTTTSTQYLIELNAQNQAEQNMKLHKIELIQAMISYKTAMGR